MSSLLRAATVQKYGKVGCEPKDGAVDPKFRQVLLNIQKTAVPHFRTNLLDPSVDSRFQGKDVEAAENVRKEGNKLFAAGKLQEALAAYNKAICLAPLPDEKSKEPELALAFANRSAVLFRQKRFAECIRDIDAAFLFGYPLSNAGKLITRKIQAALVADRPDIALSFADWVEKHPNIVIPEGAKTDLASAEEEVKNHRGPWPEMNPQSETSFEKWRMAKSLAPSAGFELGLPCFSPALGNGVSAISGYPLAMTAARDIAAGEVLLVEQAFVTSLWDGTQGTNCCACRVWTDTAFPCRSCSAVVFCSSTCSTSENGQLHVRECKIWESLSTRMDMGRGSYLLMALRTILKLTMDEWRRLMPVLTSTDPNPDIKLPPRIPELFSMPFLAFEDWCNPGELEKADLEVAIEFISVLNQVNESTDPDFMAFLAAMFVIQVSNFCSNFVPMADFVEPNVLIRTGDGIFPAFSSHFIPSCDPNTVFSFHSDYLAVRARKPIRKGEFISRTCGQSYVTRAKCDRNAFYMTSVLTECHCRACLGDWPMSTELAVRENRVKCPKCGTVNLFPADPGTWGNLVCKQMNCRQSFKDIVMGSTGFDCISVCKSLFQEPSMALVGVERIVISACLRVGNTRPRDWRELQIPRGTKMVYPPEYPPEVYM